MPLDPSTHSGQALAASLRRYLLQQFPAERAYGRADLRAEAMPPLVAAFLGWTLDRWTALERERLRSEWFDFEDDEVQAAEARLFAALGPAARVPAEAWEATLGGAVDLVVRFLTTPARALTDAVFEGSAEPLPAATVRERLTLFAAYPYLAEVAEAYLDQRHLDTLDPPALFYLLDRADRRAVRDHTPEEWLELLRPLFDLAGHLPDLGGVPASLLRDFFVAKGEDALAEQLDERVGTTLDEAALWDILAPEAEWRETEEGRGETEDREHRAEDRGQGTEGAVPENDAAPEKMGEGETEGGADAAEDDAAVPLWQRFAREGTGDGSVNAAFGEAALKKTTPDGESPTAPPKADTKAAPLWQQFSAPPAAPSTPPRAQPPVPTPAAQPGTEALDALEARTLGRTSPGQRARFVEHLFRDDAGKYAAVLHALDAASSWTEASQIIARDVFRPFRVNIYGEHAVAFTDAVEARFQR